MKLVYKSTGHEVQLGDYIIKDGIEVEVVFFAKPRTPASSGKVTVKHVDSSVTAEYFVGVIGAEWVEREDRSEE